MSSLLKPIEALNKANSVLLKKTSSFLLDNFNLNKFYYYKLHNSGRFSLFDSSLDLVECFESQQFLLKTPAFSHPKYHESGCKMHKVLEDPLFAKLEETQNSFLKLNFNLGIRFVNRTDNAVEEFGFHSSQTDEKQCLFLCNHLIELRFFSRLFLKQNTSFFSFLEESSLDLPRILGTDFYRNRIQEVDPSCLAKQKFLLALGIKVEPDLSLGELDTLKLLVIGNTALQISRQLYRSKRTIEHRIENIKKKLVCFSKQELIQKVQELGHWNFS
jgi:DNA-binding CsgD family transcriptional regulator